MVDITTPESARAALERETEIARIAARLTAAEEGWYEQESQESDGIAEPNFEAGARAMARQLWGCYEFTRMIADRGVSNLRYDALTHGIARATLEAANG